MKSLVGLCFVSTVLFAGCGEIASKSATKREGINGEGVIAAASNTPSLGDAAAQEAAVPVKSTDSVDRKIIYVADVNLVVEDFASTEREVPKLVRQFDGYLAEVSIDRSQGDHRSGQWVARIPVDQFDPFLESLDKLGVPESRHQSAQDVTEEYVDLQARITNKKRLEERILQLLEERSGKISDIIEVERELARVREEVERMEGRLRYLHNRTSLTTVTIKAREERDYVPAQAPSFTARVAQTWNGSLLTLRRFGEFSAISLVLLTPWLIWLIPAVWMLVKLCKSALRKTARSASHAQ